MKDYSNEDITIHWKPNLCKHAGICVKTLPQVYNPKSSPWITIENTSTEALKAQVSACPSGALTYSLNKKP